MAFDPTQAPGGAELWAVDGVLYLMYYAPVRPGQPGIPMLYRIRDPEALTNLGGAGRTPENTITDAERRRLGGVVFGHTEDLRGTDKHPFEQFAFDFERNAMSQPWLRDPQVLALTARAILEGRDVTDAELRSTTYWRSRTEGERRWMELAHSDPATARQTDAANKVTTQRLFAEAGYADAPQSFVDHVANQFTRGEITEDQLRQLVRTNADPYARGASPFAGRDLQPGWTVHHYFGEHFIRTPQGDWRLTGPGQIAKYAAAAKPTAGVHDPPRYVGNAEQLLGRVTPDATHLGGEEAVRALVKQWLGPLFSQGYDGRWTAEWAGKIRQNENAREQLVDYLRTQRQVVFPEHANPEHTYDDIAAPWRALVQQTWGQVADETDPLFSSIVRLNDVNAAAKVLRKEGIKRGIGTVANQALADLSSAFGSQVRPSAA